MAVINYDSGLTWNQTTVSVQANKSGSGATGSKPIFAQADKVLRMVTGTIAFDSSYPTGGEDISDIWKHFSVLTRNASTHAPATWDFRGMVVTGSGNVGRTFDLDVTNKKLKIYTANGTEAANASDQSADTVYFVAWGC